jgi:hypothetical protein
LLPARQAQKPNSTLPNFLANLRKFSVDVRGFVVLYSVNRDAHHGVYQSFAFGVTPTALGSSADFVRFLGQTSSYKPVRPWLVWSNNFRLGLAKPFSGSAVPLRGLSPSISECHDLSLRVTRVSRLELESRGELHHSRTSAAETRIALRDVRGLS